MDNETAGYSRFNHKQEKGSEVLRNGSEKQGLEESHFDNFRQYKKQQNQLLLVETCLLPYQKKKFKTCALESVT